MTATEIFKRITKLEQLTTARGATAGEAANAADLVKKLRLRLQDEPTDFISWAESFE